MAFFDSQVSIFQITDVAGPTLRDISAFLNEVRGLPGPRTMNPVTALGDAGGKHQPGLEEGSFTIAGMFDNTATTGSDFILSALRTHTSAVAFDYGPEGKASGDFKYSGTCWVTNYVVTSRVGSVVEFTCDLVVEGVVTRGTYA